MRKRLLLPAIISLAFGSSAWALSGGPFGNNEVINGGEGTYQGVLSGENLIGVMVFGYSRTSVSTGRWAVFHEGFARFGDLQGIVDTVDGTVAGVLGADSITGSNDASGGFSADMTSKAPIILFEGDGLFVSPANLLVSTAASNAVTTTDTSVVGGTTTTTTTTVTDTSSIATVEQTPFTIRGSRSSNIVGSFGAAAAVTGTTGP